MYGPNKPMMPQPEVRRPVDPGLIGMLGGAPQSQAAEPTPMSLLQLMNAGAPQASGFDQPWRRALFAAGASMLNSPGMGVGQALGRGALVGLQAYDQQRQLLAQNDATQREQQIKDALARFQMGKMQTDMMRAQRQEQAREEITAKYIPQLEAAGNDPAKYSDIFTRMVTEMVGAGVDVGGLSQGFNAIGQRGTSAQPKLMEVNQGDRIALVDPTTGNVVKTLPRSATPVERAAAAAAGKPTESMLKAAAIAPRMAAVNGTLSSLEPDPTMYIAGKLSTNWAATPEGRKMQTLGDAFLMGILRLESGAAISDQEIIRGRNTYLPQVGDDPATVRIKAQLREAAIQQARAMAGIAKVGEIAPIGSGGVTQSLQAKYR